MSSWVRWEMVNVTIPTEFDQVYTGVEILCAVAAIFGNLLVVVVFARCRRLRTVTNYYVISLAVADFLVGLVGIPSAIATSVGLPRNFHLCILMNSLLLFLCTGSILSLVAVTIDRYWAVIYPLSYNARMTGCRAIRIIAICWTLAAVIGLLPSMGWNGGIPPEPRCFFMEVIDFRYLAFIYFATIIFPSLFMAVVYGLIYEASKKQVRNLANCFLNWSNEADGLGEVWTA